MKLKTFAAAIAATTIAGSAFAADLPARKVAPAYVAPAPVMTWTGFYIGLNAGYSWANSGFGTVSSVGIFDPGPGFAGGAAASAAMAAAFPAGLNPKAQGFIGGGQIGYNWQMNSLVAGIEADAQFGSISGSASSVNAASIFPPAALPAVGSVATVSTKLDFLATVRGRLGFTVTPQLLAYATGGLAIGGVKARVAVAENFIPLGICGGCTDVFPSGGAISSTRIGYTLGGGLEWMFAQNWSVKAEYLYYSLGSSTFTTSPASIETVGGGTGVGSSFASAIRRHTVRYNGHIVRAGLNYKFGWAPAPIVAKY